MLRSGYGQPGLAVIRRAIVIQNAQQGFIRLQTGVCDFFDVIGCIVDLLLLRENTQMPAVDQDGYFHDKTPRVSPPGGFHKMPAYGRNGYGPCFAQDS